MLISDERGFYQSLLGHVYQGGMEIDFAFVNIHRQSMANTPCHRAMISRAISRQGESYTARAMIMSGDHPQDNEVVGDIISSRIRYFSAGPDQFTKFSVPYGAFSPEIRQKSDEISNYKRLVYQSRSKNSSSRMLHNKPFNKRTDIVGQKILRNI